MIFRNSADYELLLKMRVYILYLMYFIMIIIFFLVCVVVMYNFGLKKEKLCKVVYPFTTAKDKKEKS